MESLLDIFEDLRIIRNVKQTFHKKGGLYEKQIRAAAKAKRD